MPEIDAAGKSFQDGNPKLKILNFELLHNEIGICCHWNEFLLFFLQIYSLAEERLTSLSDCITSASAAECQLSTVYRPKVRSPSWLPFHYIVVIASVYGEVGHYSFSCQFLHYCNAFSHSTIPQLLVFMLLFLLQFLSTL